MHYVPERASEAHPELELVRSCLVSNDWTCAPTTDAAAKFELSAVGYIALRKTLIVLPQSLRRHVLELAHGGHQGIVCTKSRLRQKTWWPNMDQDAERLFCVWLSCQVITSPSPLSLPRLQSPHTANPSTSVPLATPGCRFTWPSAFGSALASSDGLLQSVL